LQELGMRGVRYRMEKNGSDLMLLLQKKMTNKRNQKMNKKKMKEIMGTQVTPKNKRN